LKLRPSISTKKLFFKIYIQNIIGCILLYISKIIMSRSPIILLLGLVASCTQLSPKTKKEIKEAGKEIAKQITAAAEHVDFKHEYIGFEAQPDSGEIRMYWKGADGNILGSISHLNKHIEQEGLQLLYACNGGMYMQNQAPLGYYIENGKTLRKINTKTGSGNFYLNPKGVFYVDDKNKPFVKVLKPLQTKIFYSSKK
jgi:uncharacterized protein YigE (DUF2233 family)